MLQFVFFQGNDSNEGAATHLNTHSSSRAKDAREKIVDYDCDDASVADMEIQLAPSETKPFTRSACMVVSLV